MIIFLIAGLCNIFEYIQATCALLNVGGRALAGWPKPRVKQFPPQCVFLNTANSTPVHNMIATLFNNPGGERPAFAPKGNLHPLLLTMFASIIQSLPAMIEQYGRKHNIVNKVLKTAGSFQFSEATLVAWAAQINDSWIESNTAQYTHSTPHSTKRRHP